MGRGSSYDEAPRYTRRGALRGPEVPGSKRGPHILLFVFCALFAVVAVRLVWLQVVDASDLSAAAEQNRTNVVTLTAKRGTIYDRNGNVLAMSVDCKTVYCNPHEVSDVDAAAQLLADDLGGEVADYKDLLSKDTTFVYVEKKVDSSVATQLSDDLDAADITGIYQLSDTKRIYPYGKCAGQVLGLVGSDGQGLTGLELEYNDTLQGTDGEMVMETGADGTPIAGGTSSTTEAKNGTDIVISIDINIQATAEEQIEQSVKDCSASSGTVMATDPSTGEILACCSTPLLDPSDASSATNESLQLKPVSNSYEPGSMFKCLTMAIGIENGLINADTTYNVPASVKVGDDYVYDDDRRDYAMDMTCREIMRRSSNTGAVLVGQTIGADLFAQGISNFGIGTATGIDFPGEVSGIVTQRSDYTSSSLGVMSFGQGLAVPMDQIVRAIGAIANDGTLTTPHFLIAKGEERVSWPSGGQACSASTANQVTDMMKTVVEEGTGENAQVEGVDIAGKTGTGEQAAEDGSGYKSGSYLSSFVGFAPADDPSVLIYVGLNDTSLLAYESAAPAFSAIMSEAAQDLSLNSN